MSASSPDPEASRLTANPEPAALPDAQSRNALDRILLLPWRAGLAATIAGLFVSFLAFGFWYPYWRVADMDFWIVYNGFLLNDGRPQEYFEHPGYLSILLLSGFLRALHAIGVLDVVSLSALPPVKDAAAFHDAWTQATRAGRVLSFALASALVLSFGVLIRRLVGDWRVAALATFVLALSVLIVWAVTGPLFHFSDTWQLVINTSTTIITFLMVFLIQNTQNRDTEAIQIKLDELIRATQGAHNALLDLEELEAHELDLIRAGYVRLAQKAREGLREGAADTGVPDLP